MTVPSAKRVTRYLTVVLRWAVIVTVVFVATLVAGLYVIDRVLPKVYTASAMIELPASDLVTPTAPHSILEPVAFQPEFENTMLSPEFLLAVVKDLGLDKEWAKRMNDVDGDALPDVDALTRLGKQLKIEIKRGTNVVKITAASDVPVEAARIANAVADRYRVARVDDSTLTSPVRILTRAETPAEPTRPNRNLDFMLTLALAIVLGITAASFVEIVFLFVRAGERAES